MTLRPAVFRLSFCFAVLSLIALGSVASLPAWAAGAKQPVSLTAVVVPGAKPLAGASFTVTPLGGGAGDPVTVTAQDGPAKVDLPKGRYKIEASYGDAKAAQEIMIDQNPASHEFDLQAGTVFLKLIKHVGGPTMNTGVEWEILTYGKDSTGKRHYISGSDQSQPRFVLPDGWYLARATVGTQVVKHTIEVTAGQTYKYTVILQ